MSHQWLGFDEPDAENVHYVAICQAVSAVCKKFTLDADNVYLWIDFFSIPQKNVTLKQLSIGSLGVYASVVEFFVVICPETVHLSTGKGVNEHSYQRRGWCRLEQWAHMSLRGLDHMYLFRSNTLELMGLETKWYSEAIKVFDGDFTVDSDKEKLVDTLLGLWALALAGRNSSGSSEWITADY